MKYILKKEYPGSPKLGYIDDLNKSGHNNQGEYVQSMYDKNPEFWEKVVEKDYKILSLARFCSIKPTITDVSDYGDEYIEAMLKCDNARIHSVKRLSDGEIFTIGDKLEHNMVIESFKFENFGNGEKLTAQDKNGGRFLNELKKVKQKLFTTEDGVDIFKGDLVVCFDKDSFCIRNKTYLFKEHDKNDKTYLFFSTKEKAEEYILYNKPLLTLRDIDELLCKNTSSYFLEKFKKRAQKIK